MLLVLNLIKHWKGFKAGQLAWKIPWMEEPGRLLSMGLLRVRYDWVTSLPCIGEGNGTPLQCSCLENSMDGGAWWAAVHGVTKSQTRLSDSLSRIGEGNDNPLQCSCLENPRDGEPGGLPSVGSHRVGHNWIDLAAAAVLCSVSAE